MKLTKKIIKEAIKEALEENYDKGSIEQDILEVGSQLRKYGEQLYHLDQRWKRSEVSRQLSQYIEKLRQIIIRVEPNDF